MLTVTRRGFHSMTVSMAGGKGANSMTSDEAEAGQPVENWHVHYQGCPSCALLQDEARAELRAKLAAKVRAIKDSEITAEVNAQGAAGYAIGRDEARKRLTLRLIEGSDPANPEAPEHVWRDDMDRLVTFGGRLAESPVTGEDRG